MTKAKDKSPAETSGRDLASEIANTFEWLIIAFVLAFVFRSFVLEAFRIPTGSMADTLMGAHFRLRCIQCGYKYDHGADSGYQPINLQRRMRSLPSTRCPSCGYVRPVSTVASVSGGDRILVLKCLYQFVEPKQWDVVVFKNPLEPKINYIKRLIGRPGQKLEIIDGDVYIDGEISRKPPRVQKDLWMPIYDNDFQPAKPDEPFFNGHVWRQPFKNTADSRWELDKANPVAFALDSPAEQVHMLYYDTSAGNDFRASYAYNDVSDYSHRPYCSDLMLRFYVSRQGHSGSIGAVLSKYESVYRGWVDFSGEMIITERYGGKEDVLARKQIDTGSGDRAVLFGFANVDHQLILRFGKERLMFDLGQTASDAGPRKTDIEPQVKIFGSGSLKLSQTALFRDIHYISQRYAGTSGGRGTEGHPFELEADEFFVLGDNSPNSQDGRWWNQEGIGNSDTHYRAGIVPRDYLVGKALYVYWPAGYDFPWPAGLKHFLARNSGRNRLLNAINALINLNWIPDISRMRFIYGGREQGGR